MIDRSNLFKIVGYEPSEAQNLLHSSIDDGIGRVVAVYGRQAGKTHSATHEALYQVLQPADDFGPPLVYVVSDTYSHSEKIYNQILNIFRTKLKAFFEGHRQKPTPEIRTAFGGKIIFKSAENPASLAGDTVSFCILEESSFIPDRAISVLLPALTPRKAQVFCIGTADHTVNFFYQWYLKGQNPDYENEYVSFNLPSWVNPKQDRDYIERTVKADISEADYRKYYLAEFADSSETVFKTSHLERAVTLHSSEDPILNARYIAGLDLAQLVDYTVLTILKIENGVASLVHFDRWQKASWDYTCQRAAEALKRYNHAHCYVDATGVGNVVKEILNKYYTNYTPVIFTQPSKADMIDNLRIKFEREELLLFPEPVLLNELKALKGIQTQKGISYKAPNGQHDDCAFSLALAGKGIAFTYNLPKGLVEGWNI